MNYQDYNNYTQKPPTNKNKSNNNAMIILIAVLASVLVIALVVIVLLATGALGGQPDPAPSAVQQVQQQPQQETEAAKPAPTPSKPVEPQPVPVQQTMYVDCNTTLTLRTGPATSFSEITKIPVGSAVYVIEYTNNEFARITFNGTEGYVMRSYLSPSRPNVWEYNAADVEQFVENSLYGYINAINTGDTSFVYDFYSGNLINEELASINNNRKAAASETMVSVNCHSATRVSKTEVSVIRESTIRVYYHNGDVKDVVERYKYIVDGSSGRMYITSLEAM